MDFREYPDQLEREDHLVHKENLEPQVTTKEEAQCIQGGEELIVHHHLLSNMKVSVYLCFMDDKKWPRFINWSCIHSAFAQRFSRIRVAFSAYIFGDVTVFVSPRDALH